MIKNESRDILLTMDMIYLHNIVHALNDFYDVYYYWLYNKGTPYLKSIKYLIIKLI